MGIEGLHVRFERRGRQRDVVHDQGVIGGQLPRPCQRVGEVAGVGGGGEAVAREQQVVAHGRELGVVAENVAHVLGEPRVVLIFAAVADQHPLVGHQIVHGQRREGGQHQPPGPNHPWRRTTRRSSGGDRSCLKTSLKRSRCAQEVPPPGNGSVSGMSRR